MEYKISRTATCIFVAPSHDRAMGRAKKAHAYQINLIPEKEGGYTVLVPSLQGCVSYGETVEDATRNAAEAIELHLENLAAHKLPIPDHI